MKKEQRNGIIAVAIATAWLWSGAACAQTPEAKCNAARLQAWGDYQECIASVLAKDAGPPSSASTHELFARCRHRYFDEWTDFQTRA